MSLHHFSEKEEKNKPETVNNYKYLFKSYENNLPTLSEALEQMFKSESLDEEDVEELTCDILNKCKNVINNNYVDIKNKYKNLSKEDSEIICAYTCESLNNDYSPYKILNKNLVSQNRREGVEKISKYLYIFLKALRKLPVYYPSEKDKYLYRCIRPKVNYQIHITKTFWGFTSTSQEKQTSFDFLGGGGGNQNIKTGTIFRLEGDNLWGYDIQLFNYFNEKEIILEPERKYIVDDILDINDIIYINCKMKKAPLILENIKSTTNNNQINYETNDFIKENKKRYNIRKDNAGNKNDNYIKNDNPYKIIDNNINIIIHNNIKKPNIQIPKSKWKEGENQKKDKQSSSENSTETTKIRDLGKSLEIKSRLNLNYLYDTNSNKIINLSKKKDTINLDRNLSKPNINFKKGSMKKQREKETDEEFRKSRDKLFFRDGEKIIENNYKNNEDKISIHNYKNFGFQNEEEYEMHKAKEKSLLDF